MIRTLAIALALATCASAGYAAGKVTRQSMTAHCFGAAWDARLSIERREWIYVCPASGVRLLVPMRADVTIGLETKYEGE